MATLAGPSDASELDPCPSECDFSITFSTQSALRDLGGVRVVHGYLLCSLTHGVRCNPRVGMTVTASDVQPGGASNCWKSGSER